MTFVVCAEFDPENYQGVTVTHPFGVRVMYATYYSHPPRASETEVAVCGGSVESHDAKDCVWYSQHS